MLRGSATVASRGTPRDRGEGGLMEARPASGSKCASRAAGCTRCEALEERALAVGSGRAKAPKVGARDHGQRGVQSSLGPSGSARCQRTLDRNERK